ncbi:MAG: CHASE2 domain-containing protein [Nitrospinota bacterium]
MFRIKTYCYLSIFTISLGVFFTLTPYGSGFEENLGLKTLFWFRGAKKPSPEAVIVSLDKQSAEKLNLPLNFSDWPRTKHARLIEKLTRAGAQLIVFDIHFRKKTPDDHLFSQIIKKSNNVVLVEYFENHAVKNRFSAAGFSENVLMEKTIPPVHPLKAAAVATAIFPLPKIPVLVSQAWVFRGDFGAAPTLPSVALQISARPFLPEFLSLLQERLGQSKGEGGLKKEQDLAILKKLTRQIQKTALVSVPITDLMKQVRQIFINHSRLRNSLIETLKKEIPGDSPKKRILTSLVNLYSQKPSRFINFYGPPRTIKTIPYHKILNSDDEKPPLPDLKGKVVFVGESLLTQYRHRDAFYTVFSQQDGLNLSGVEICATVFLNLLNNSSVRNLSPLAHLAIILLCGLIVPFIWTIFSPFAALGWIFTILFLYSGTAFFLFSSSNLWLPLGIPLIIQIPLGSIGTLLWNNFETRKSHNLIRKAFGHYLPDTIVDQLSQNLEGLKEGQLVYGICLFSDVQNYTVLSESLRPETLQTLMNEYFNTLFEPVKRHGGVVLSLQGDSMLVVWASTYEDPQLRKAACTAAIEISEAADRFNQSPGAPPLITRIGLHCGEMYLGHVGGQGRFEYTVMGDIVNTASRLEGLNKYVGTRLLVSEEVISTLTDFLTREIGTFKLKGKGTTVTVYEILELKSNCTGQQERLCQMFSAALDLCKNQKWLQANNRLKELLVQFPTDGPGQFYLNFSQDEMSKARIKKWDGIISLDKK